VRRGARRLSSSHLGVVGIVGSESCSSPPHFTAVPEEMRTVQRTRSQGRSWPTVNHPSVWGLPNHHRASANAGSGPAEFVPSRGSSTGRSRGSGRQRPPLRWKTGASCRAERPGARYSSTHRCTTDPPAGTERLPGVDRPCRPVTTDEAAARPTRRIRRSAGRYPGSYGRRRDQPTPGFICGPRLPRPVRPGSDSDRSRVHHEI
jgi:hypothetical protein